MKTQKLKFTVTLTTPWTPEDTRKLIVESVRKVVSETSLPCFWMDTVKVKSVRTTK